MKNPIMEIEDEGFQKLIEQYLEIKDQQDNLKNRKDAVMAQIRQYLGLPDDTEGTYNYQSGPFRVSARTSVTRKVDKDAVEEIVKATGMGAEAQRLFRYKLDLNTENWRMASDSVKQAFAPAITATPASLYLRITETKTNK